MDQIKPPSQAQFDKNNEVLKRLKLNLGNLDVAVIELTYDLEIAHQEIYDLKLKLSAFEKGVDLAKNKS